MQSHDDRDFSPPRTDLEPPALAALRREAGRLTALGLNRITAGAPGESFIAQARRGGFLIGRLPDDPLALRVSIGEAHERLLGGSAHLVFRGDPRTIEALLRRALAALDGATLARTDEP